MNTEELKNKVFRVCKFYPFMLIHLFYFVITQIVHPMFEDEHV